MKTYDYYGIALTEEREGTNCGGHLENKESCIHLKFGAPFKYASFTPDFEKKHPDFIKMYDEAKEDDRAYMLKLGREIIRLKQADELVVICNMCDLECPTYMSVVMYALSQSPFNFTIDELTK